jgi:predicted thioesterase
MDFSEIVKPGLKAEITLIVEEKYTASAVGSGGLSVLSTPWMIGLMEMAALSAVQPLLPEGWPPVGTELNVTHLAATVAGVKVRGEAELVETDGRRLVFKVEALDETGKIGEGTHGRFIVENERFVQKARERAKSVS